MPSLAGATRWIGAEPANDQLAGHPVVVHFWALSCHLCHEQMPELRRMQETYAPRGVRFVAVHMPREEADTSIPAVEAAVNDNGLDEPVAVDNEHVLGDRFETGGLWPMYFLFDADGKLRARSAGAAGPSVVEAALARLAPEGQP